jgi:hypothetical protein
MKWFGLACVLAILLPRVGLADEPTPVTSEAPVARTGSRDITIEVPGERTRNNKLIIGGIAAGGVLVGALGLYFHLDSRDAANEVSADRFNGKSWSQKQIDLVARADRSKTRAEVSYVIGGGLLLGAVIAYIVTSPKSETSVIHTSPVGVVPTGDGGMVTGMWSF